MDETKSHSFTDLEVWKRGHELVLIVYSCTTSFPKCELYGLVSQLRRCAVSITSNLAEGYGRSSLKEKLQFYNISLGSLSELYNQMIISRDLHYLHPVKYLEIEEKITLIRKLLNGLIRKIESFK